MATLLAIAAPYRQARVLAFLDPWADPTNTGYQNIQSLVGLASGGVAGVGLGASRASGPRCAHSDFIFAIIGEELGWVGAAVVVGLFGLLGVIGIRIALHAPDRFGLLLAVGVTAWFLVQAFVNIGAVIGILPIFGDIRCRSSARAARPSCSPWRGRGCCCRWRPVPDRPATRSQRSHRAAEYRLATRRRRSR